MKNIKIFILHGCPYCHNAMKAWKELTAQEAYQGMTAEWIYEDEHPEAASGYDHYTALLSLLMERKYMKPILRTAMKLPPEKSERLLTWQDNLLYHLTGYYTKTQEV